LDAGAGRKERKPDGTIVYWDRLIEQNGISLSYYNCNTEEERIQKLNEFYENRFAIICFYSCCST